MAKPRKSLPKGVQRATDNEPQIYAYEINDPNYGETLYIKKSIYGWWNDREKVEKLIDAYKIDCTDIRACFYAGITRKQLEYFIEIHPEFIDFRAQIRENLSLVAQQVFAGEIKKNPAAAAAYLKNKEENERRREEYAKKKAQEEEGEPANAVVFVDFADPQNALPAGKQNDHADAESE